MVTDYPHFNKINGVETLVVNSEPYLAFAGEIHNSSASSLEYMNLNIWSKLEELNLNTVLLPIYWEMIESIEGQYQFEHVANIIDQARENNKKVILLWFGLWKNGMSTYVPEWMKKNREDYPFIESKYGEQIYSISPMSGKAVEKNSLVFGELMAFIKSYDSSEQTVLMVQIENEIGSLGTDFDYASNQVELLDSMVPADVESFSNQTGTWNQVFRENSKEYLMAYYYAKAIEKNAALGHEKHPIPYFVNAWLEKKPSRAGEYPSGGPIGRLIPFWKKIAPSLASFAPDIYVPNFDEVCNEFMSPQDVLIIPEARQDIDTVSNLIYSMGKYNLVCFSPFGIEDIADAGRILSDSTLQTLSIDADAFDPQGTSELLAEAYLLLQGLTSLIIEKRGTNQIHAFSKETNANRGENIKLAECETRVNFIPFTKGIAKSAGMIIEISEEEFIVLGINISLTLQSKMDMDKNVGILSLEDGKFENKKWIRDRILNGDDRYDITIGNMPKLLRFKYHVY